VGDVADEVGFLSRKLQLTIQIADNQPAAGANGDEQQCNQKPKSQFDCSSRFRKASGIEQISGDFPVRQSFTDLRRNKRMFPAGAKCGLRQCNRLCGIVENREAELRSKFAIKIKHERVKFSNEMSNIQLRTEDVTRFSRRAVPEENVQLIVNEPGKCSFRGLADQLLELGFSGSHFGNLLWCCGGTCVKLVNFFQFFGRLNLLLRIDVSRHWRFHLHAAGGEF
jgi:hypothetical protein